jgi:hypothetical protein
MVIPDFKRADHVFRQELVQAPILRPTPPKSPVYRPWHLNDGDRVTMKKSTRKKSAAVSRDGNTAQGNLG